MNKVVIVGAGFGGLNAAQALAGGRAGTPVDVTLVDSRNFHIFQPLLYQVATAALEPEQIVNSVRGMLHEMPNVHFQMATVTGVDWAGKRLLTHDTGPIPFDYLILAAGAVSNDFGIPGVKEYGFGLKDINDALTIRDHIIHQFENADAHPELIENGALTFVVVGGGPTGVEMAGALTELFHLALRKDFPHVDIKQAKVILLEAMDKLLPPFDAAVLGVPLGRGGRVVVNDDLSIPDHPEAFVIGDLAAGKDSAGNIYPQLAQAAIQSGKHTAAQILRRMRGEVTQPFAYRDPGFMATIGRNAAVAQLPNGAKFTGFVAWVLWLFLHLLFLVGFRNRVQVFVNWVWSYIWHSYPGAVLFGERANRTGKPNDF